MFIISLDPFQNVTLSGIMDVSIHFPYLFPNGTGVMRNAIVALVPSPPLSFVSDYVSTSIHD